METTIHLEMTIEKCQGLVNQYKGHNPILKKKGIGSPFAETLTGNQPFFKNN